MSRDYGMLPYGMGALGLALLMSRLRQNGIQPGANQRSSNDGGGAPASAALPILPAASPQVDPNFIRPAAPSTPAETALTDPQVAQAYGVAQQTPAYGGTSAAAPTVVTAGDAGNPGVDPLAALTQMGMTMGAHRNGGASPLASVLARLQLAGGNSAVPQSGGLY